MNNFAATYQRTSHTAWDHANASSAPDPNSVDDPLFTADQRTMIRDLYLRRFEERRVEIRAELHRAARQRAEQLRAEQQQPTAIDYLYLYSLR